jgi:hypothetical protein
VLLSIAAEGAGLAVFDAATGEALLRDAQRAAARLGAAGAEEGLEAVRAAFGGEGGAPLEE